MAQYTPNDPMAKPMLYGGLALLGTTVFVLVSNLMHTIDKNSTKGAADISMALAVAEQNLAPVGSVTTVDKSIVKEARTGEAVFNAVCTSCHAAGVLGAPKIDDKAAWEPRAAQGLDGLLKNAQNGIRSMPARGGDPTITDEELTNAIIYMTGKAGIDLKAGAAAAAPAAATPAAAAPAAATPAAATPAAAAPAAAATPAAATPAAAAPAAAAPAAAAPAAAAPDAATLAAGEKVFNAVCTACHTAGVLNAPKLDDKAAWEPRVAQGLDGLLTSAKNGKNAMPAKGGNPALTDEELTNSILYMTNKAGFNLAAPAAAAPAAAAAAPAAAAAQAAPAAAAPAAAAPAAAAPAAQAAPVAAIDGEKVYKSTCFACHDVGVANAPKLGDKAAWDARVATGKDALYGSALHGKNVMPAKGGNANLSDDEVKAAVDYMVGKAQ